MKNKDKGFERLIKINNPTFIKVIQKLAVNIKMDPRSVKFYLVSET